MNDSPQRGELYWTALDPTVGSETQKTRPCVIISNNAQNKKSKRVIVAPVTSKMKTVYPFEAKVMVNNQACKAMLDQIRSVDKQRLGRKIASLDIETMINIDQALKIALSLK